MTAPSQPRGLRHHGGRALRFALVGGAFSLFYSVVSALLVGKAGMPPLPTSVVVYALCIPAAFAVQKSFTFRRAPTRRFGFVFYAGTQVASLALVAAVTTRFVSGEVALDTLLFLATSGLAALFSFAVTSVLSFRPGA